VDGDGQILDHGDVLHDRRLSPTNYLVKTVLFVGALGFDQITDVQARAPTVGESAASAMRELALNGASPFDQRS
jgi:hypothetical protein